MRPLPPRKESLRQTSPLLAAIDISLLLVLLTTGVWTLGCGGGGAGSVGPPPPPPPPSITVAVSAPSGSVLLGNTMMFTATVKNTTDTSVSWSVNSIPGGSAVTGTIAGDGTYTAPIDLPSPASVQITATSHADRTKSGSAQLMIISDLGITIAPSTASAELGATQAFHAAISSGGHPDTAVRWSLSGSARGSVDSSGNYTAPGILPSPPNANLTAQSVADPSKQTSVAVAITSNFSLQLMAPQSVPAGGSATIVATLTPVPGSNPSTILSWSLSGPGCSGSSCGTLVAGTKQGSGGAAVSESATYTAPSTAPNPCQPIRSRCPVLPLG